MINKMIRKTSDEEVCYEIPQDKLPKNDVALRSIMTMMMNREEKLPKCIDFNLTKYMSPDKLSVYADDNPIIPNDIKCFMKANYSQGSSVQTYCIEVATQALITVPDSEFGNVPTIQKKAQENANIWLSDLNKRIIDIYTKEKQYCNLIISYEGDTDQLVDKLETGKPEAKDNFINQIGLLKDQADSNKGKVISLVNSLNDFREKIGSDATEFGTIKSKADIKYNANDGEMKLLKDGMDALKEDIATCNAIIAGGAAAIAVGAMVIAVGTLLTVPSGGITALIIGAGTVISGAGSAMVGVAKTQRDKDEEEYIEKSTRFSTLQETCNLLQALSGQLGNLTLSNKKAILATQAMSLAWSTISGNIGNIIENLDSIINDVDQQALLKRWLRTLVMTGKDLKELSAKYESQGVLPVVPDEKVWRLLNGNKRIAIPTKENPLSAEEYLVLLERKIARPRNQVYISRNSFA